MKQQYIKPETTVVFSDSPSILSGSAQSNTKEMDIYNNTTDVITDGEMFLSKKHDDIWDDDK